MSGGAIAMQRLCTAELHEDKGTIMARLKEDATEPNTGRSKGQQGQWYTRMHLGPLRDPNKIS